MMPGLASAMAGQNEPIKVELTRGIAIMKKYGWIAPAVLLLAVATYSPSAHAYESICPQPQHNLHKIAQSLGIDYATAGRVVARECANVGRSAYNALGPDWLRAIYLGPIRRVIWMDVGDIITMPDGISRISSYSGFMYVIGPGGVATHNFFRWGNDVAPVVEYAWQANTGPAAR